MLDILWIAFWTLVIYSGVATLIITVSDNDDDVTAYLAYGIVGCTLGFMLISVEYLIKLFKHHVGKRTIVEDSNTGKEYICKTSDAVDVSWLNGYRIKNRYATKNEWKGIPYISKELIKKSRINCNNCVHDRECRNLGDSIKCEHDKHDNILDFDKFVRR